MFCGKCEIWPSQPRTSGIESPRAQENFRTFAGRLEFERILDIRHVEPVADQRFELVRVSPHRAHQPGEKAQVVVPGTVKGDSLSNHVRADSYHGILAALPYKRNASPPSDAVNSEPMGRGSTGTIDRRIHSQSTRQIPNPLECLIGRKSHLSTEI